MTTTSRTLSLFFSLGVLTLSGCAILAPVTTTAEIIYNRHEIAHFFDQIHHTNILEAQVAKAKLDQGNHIQFAETEQSLLVYGQVQNESQKKLLSRIIMANNNSKKLYNALEITAPSSYQQRMQDTLITTKLKAKYLVENTRNLTKIKVITDNGTVFLLGKVNKADALQAIQIAQQTQGVKKIIKVFNYNA